MSLRALAAAGLESALLPPMRGSRSSSRLSNCTRKSSTSCACSCVTRELASRHPQDQRRPRRQADSDQAAPWSGRPVPSESFAGAASFISCCRSRVARTTRTIPASKDCAVWSDYPEARSPPSRVRTLYSLASQWQPSRRGGLTRRCRLIRHESQPPGQQWGDPVAHGQSPAAWP